MDRHDEGIIVAFRNFVNVKKIAIFPAAMTINNDWENPKEEHFMFYLSTVRSVREPLRHGPRTSSC